MISIRRSSVERSPPLASGWCCFTSALYFALTVSSVASEPSPTTRTRPPAAAAVEFREHAERIGGAFQIGLRAALALLGAGIGAHFPGRTVAGQRVLLVARDRIGIHAGEEIVGLVVFADVVETE